MVSDVGATTKVTRLLASYGPDSRKRCSSRPYTLPVQHSRFFATSRALLSLREATLVAHRGRRACSRGGTGVTGMANGCLAARRSFWSRNGKGKEDASKDTFAETTDSAGDSWTPPPNAWEPEDVSAAEPQDSFPDAGPGSDFATSAADIGATVAAAGPDTATTLTAAGLSAADLTLFYPHHLFMKLIDAVHVTAGVPYWEAIVITSLVARCAVLPALVNFQGMTKRMAIARVEIEPLQAKLNDIKARVEANPELKDAGTQEMMVVVQDMQKILRSHRVSYPTMLLSVFAQIPVFISLFVATKEMGTYFPGYATGGLEWVPDLTAPDPTYVLPAITCATMMVMVELGGDVQAPQQGQGGQQAMMKNMFRLMSVIFVPVAFNMPAGVLVYWSTTNVFGLVQRGLFNVRSVQKLFGWPMPEDIPAPKPQEGPREAEFSDKEDLQRWGREGTNGSRESTEALRQAAEAAERARDAIAKESKIRHEELKRQHSAGKAPPGFDGSSKDKGNSRDRP